MNLKPHQSFLHILHPSLQATWILRLEQILPAPPSTLSLRVQGRTIPSRKWKVSQAAASFYGSFVPTTANRPLMPITQWNELYHYQLQTSWTNSRLLHLRCHMNFCKSHYCQSIIKKVGSSPIASTWCHNEAHNSRIPTYKFCVNYKP